MSKIVYFNKTFSERLLYLFGCNVIYIPNNVNNVKEYLISLEYNDNLYEKSQFILKNWSDNILI
jgi:hypothetical protein